MKKVYNFRLNKDDDEIEKILEKRTGSERSAFIKAAIMFYDKFYPYGDRINDIAAEIKEIRALIEKGGVIAATKDKGLSSEGTEENPQKLDIDAEKIIADSIQDILNLGN